MRYSPSGLLPQQPAKEWVTAWWTSDPGVSSSSSEFPGSEAQGQGVGSTGAPGGVAPGLLVSVRNGVRASCWLTALTPRAHSAN